MWVSRNGLRVDVPFLLYFHSPARIWMHPSALRNRIAKSRLVNPAPLVTEGHDSTAPRVRADADRPVADPKSAEIRQA